MVGQFSPCKPRAYCSPSLRSLRPGAAMLAAFEGAARGGAGSGQHGSPTAVAYMPAAPSTASQPSSATSSLAAALADLQVSSRQSSENDLSATLGDRAKLLAALGLPPTGSRGHLSRSSSDGDLIAVGPAHPAAVTPEETLCCVHLLGAVISFDTLVLKTLTPIKTRGASGSSGTRPAGGEAAGGMDGLGEPPASLAAAYADSLISPFHDPPAGMKAKQLQPLGAAARPMIFHTRNTSMTAPGAYNPYDLTAAALSSEFRSPAKSLHSPFPSSSSSRGPSASATPSQWGSASYRASAYRMAAQQALAAQKDDEPDFYISMPGVRRQQSVARVHSNLGQQSTGSAGAACAAAAGTAGGASAHQAGDASAAAGSNSGKPLTPAQRVGGQAGRSLERQPTLGSGTAVHGFKGLFRSIIVSGATTPTPGDDAR